MIELPGGFAQHLLLVAVAGFLIFLVICFIIGVSILKVIAFFVGFVGTFIANYILSTQFGFTIPYVFPVAALAGTIMAFVVRWPDDSY